MNGIIKKQLKEYIYKGRCHLEKLDISGENFDCWSANWNEAGVDETRRDLLEFLQAWREREGDWFTEVSGQFFSLIEEKIGAPEKVNEFAWLVRWLHLANHTLWHFEDEVRRDDVAPAWIVEVKRGIDAVNQKRNDQMEKIDEYVLKALEVDPADETIPLHSEPPGLMLDRISILSLKKYHYSLKEGRAETVALIKQQRSDLLRAFDRFLARLASGELRFRIYRQFKTYNDPATNPALENA